MSLLTYIGIFFCGAILTVMLGLSFVLILAWMALGDGETGMVGAVLLVIAVAGGTILLNALPLAVTVKVERTQS